MDGRVCRVIYDSQEKEYAYGTKFLDIAREYHDQYRDDIILAVFNNKLWELNRTIEMDGELSFLTAADTKGRKAYRRSMVMLLEKAIYNLYGTSVKLRVMHTLGQGQYCELEGSAVCQELLDKIGAQMQKLVEADIEIRKNTIHTDLAIARFMECGMEDKAKLFQFRRSSHVNIYDMDGFQDYFYGYMVPSTGYLKYFDLLLYEDGFVLVFPYEDTKKTAVFETSKKLYHTLMEAAAWAKQMQIRTVGELNEQIVKGKVQDIILLQEAEMEKRISKIAEQIAAEKNKSLS